MFARKSLPSRREANIHAILIEHRSIPFVQNLAARAKKFAKLFNNGEKKGAEIRIPFYDSNLVALKV